MDDLLIRIDEITKYGLAKIDSNHNRLLDLKINLLGLISIRLYIQMPEEPCIDKPVKQYSYDEIRRTVVFNFPDFGFYHTVLNPLDIYNEPNLAIGDSVDDITDVIKGLLEIKDKYINSTACDFMSSFIIEYDQHLKYHVLNLLQYIESYESANSSKD